MIKNEEKLVLLLKEKKLHITFAESCTGGLAAGALVNVSGASDVFDASFVTYANEAKINLVGVKKETLDTLGAVSAEVALQMAKGAAKAANADVGVGISGIAGPTGGSKDKPVGTVCFGFSTPKTSVAEKVIFENRGREAIRRAAVDYVYERLISLLSE